MKGGITIGIKSFIKHGSTRKLLVLLVVISVVISLTIALSIKRKTITLIIDGQPVKFVTYKSTVNQALQKQNITIGSKDKVTPSLQSKLTENETINIKRAVNLKVSVDGKVRNIQSCEETIDSMLKAEGITLYNEDQVIPDIKTKISDQMVINIIRVESKTIIENIPIAFKEVVKNDKNLPNTKRRIIQEGRNGEKQIAYRVVYENDKAVSKEIICESIVKQPIDRQLVQGTYPLMPVSRGGNPMAYRNVFRSRTTAYWAVNGIGKTYTASGRKAVRDPEGFSTVAVDPDVIPFGTKLFIEGYGFAIAAESGSAIKGNIIDVFFDTKREALDWAVKNVNVYLLK